MIHLNSNSTQWIIPNKKGLMQQSTTTTSRRETAIRQSTIKNYNCRCFATHMWSKASWWHRWTAHSPVLSSASSKQGALRGSTYVTRKRSLTDLLAASTSQLYIVQHRYGPSAALSVIMGQQHPKKSENCGLVACYSAVSAWATDFSGSTGDNRSVLPR